MGNYATYRKAKNPAFGYIIMILGVDYGQKGTAAEAASYCEQINAECDGMTPAEVYARYKLGHQ